MKKQTGNTAASQLCKAMTMLLVVSLFAVPAAAEEDTADTFVTSVVSESTETEETATVSGSAVLEDAEEAGETVVTKEEIEENSSKPEAVAIDLDSDWITFFLICNEGMSDRGGNSGNTMMLIAVNQETGKIRLAPFAWDTFMNYEGYDAPQRIDMAYRNNGPEETIKVFNANMGTDVQLFMSLNFLNLATLINDYGGVTVDVSRAERNALNSMVASKKESILNSEDASLLSELAAEMLADEYYLNEFGEDITLNGLQAVGYGWLQYDSVHNCCERDAEIVGNLFSSLGESMSEQVVLYTNEYEKPEVNDSRRVINLDEVTEEDLEFLGQSLSPIIDTSYNNLQEEGMMKLALAFARAYYYASRQGINIMEHLEYSVFPLELTQPVDKIAGAEGHVIDYEKNAQAITEFLFAE